MYFRRLMFILLFLLLLGRGLSQEEEKELNFYGEMNTRMQVRIAGRDSTRLTWFRSALSLGMVPIARERFEGKIGVTVRMDGFPYPEKWMDLTRVTELEPVAILLDEAFIRFYDVLPGLNLTLGRQKVRWGTADVINPTDNFATPDYSDPLVWDERRPVWMAHLGWKPLPALGGELGIKPVFQPAISPPGEWFSTNVLPGEEELRSFLVGEFIRQGLDSTTAREIAALYTISSREEIVLPGRNIRNATCGGRLKGHIGVFDFSLSYLHGYNFLPTVEPVMNVDPLNRRLDFVLKERFLSKQVLGADAAANIAGVGTWLEAGYALYSDTAGKNGVSLIGGLDYSWSGFYANLQFLYGDFPLAQSSAEKGTFILGAIERKFFSDRLLTRIGGVLDLKKGSFGLTPLLRLTPFNGIEIEMGGLVFKGDEGTKFARLNPVKELFGGVRYRF